MRMRKPSGNESPHPRPLGESSRSQWGCPPKTVGSIRGYADPVLTFILTVTKRRHIHDSLWTLQHKALGLTFILVLTCLVLGSAALLLGISVTPFGTDRWVDGNLQDQAYVLMIPASFELARIRGERAPRLAIFCAAGALGWGMSIVAAVAKGIQMDLINAGLNESVWNVLGSTPATASVFISSMLGILSALLLGIGLLWKGGVNRSTAILFTAGTVFFLVGVGGGAEIAWWQIKVAFPLASVLWLAALAPIGLRYFGGGSRTEMLKPVTT